MQLAVTAMKLIPLLDRQGPQDRVGSAPGFGLKPVDRLPEGSKSVFKTHRGGNQLGKCLLGKLEPRRHGLGQELLLEERAKDDTNKSRQRILESIDRLVQRGCQMLQELPGRPVP